MPTPRHPGHHGTRFAATAVGLSATALLGVLLTRWPEAMGDGDEPTLAFGRWLLGAWADPMPGAIPLVLIGLSIAVPAHALASAFLQGFASPAVEGCLRHGPIDVIAAGLFVGLTGLALTFEGMPNGVEHGRWALHEIGNTAAAAGVLTVLVGFLLGGLSASGPRASRDMTVDARGTQPGR